jgi:formate-dependent nitrite reductase membrane component NrfD
MPEEEITVPQAEEMFVLELRPQQVWGAEIAAEMFLSGTGAAVFFLAVVLKSADLLSARAAWIGEWIGLGAVALAAFFLLAHLGVPTRFLEAFRRPHTSWLSRGAWSITFFGAFAFLVALAALPGLDALPWGEGTVAGTVLSVIALVFAVAVMAYTGLLLASWPSIPFWNTPLLPLLFMASSLLGAAGALLGLLILVDGNAEALRVLTLSLALGVGLGLLFYLQGMGGATAPARTGAQLLLRGEGRWPFLLGVGAIGLAIPALLLGLDLLDALGVADTALRGLSGIFVLVGGFYLRHTILKAGVYGYPV